MDISIFQSGKNSISEGIITELGDYLARYKDKGFASFTLDGSALDDCNMEVTQHLSAYADDVDDLSEVIKVELAEGRRGSNLLRFSYENDYNKLESEVVVFMTFDQVKFLSELLVKEIDKAEKIMDIKNS